jgi:predicted nucleic acid-binding protein
MSKRLVDTNLIIRYLVQDHERHAKAAGGLFEACDRGDVVLVVLPEVVAECVFVLESFYKHQRADIARTLGALVNSPGVELAELSIHLDALNRYSASKLHFVDCTIAATAAAHQLAIATFDSDFKKFADIKIDLE